MPKGIKGYRWDRRPSLYAEPKSPSPCNEAMNTEQQRTYFEHFYRHNILDHVTLEVSGGVFVATDSASELKDLFRAAYLEGWSDCAAIMGGDRLPGA